MTQLAVPLVAVLTLRADAAQMGVLGAVDRAPYLLFGLLVGVWIDRRRRRPVMVWAAAAEAVLLLSIPLAAVVGVLSLLQLYFVGFLAGATNLAFDVAGMAMLPVLVPRDRLVEGNTRLQASESVAATVGPPLAGALIQAITAPLAILVDGLATVLKMAVLVAVPADPMPVGGARTGLWIELREGLAVVFGNRLLRSIAFCTALSNLAGFAFASIFILFVVRDLGLTPAQIGLTFAAGGLAAMLGVLLAGRVARRIGVGPAIVLAIVGAAGGNLLVPWLPAGWVPALPLLMLSSAVKSAGGVAYNINQVSLRQAITPDRLQGRMGATMRFLVWGVIPIGALAGGLLGQAVGLRTALWITALLGPLAVVPLLVGGVYRLREVPAPQSRS